MVWQVALAVGSAALSVYGQAQSAAAAKDAARARAIANKQTAKQLRTEAAGRRLINLDNLHRSNSAIIAASGARGITVESASNMARLRSNEIKYELDNLSVDATTEQRIANLWADSDAAYRKAQLQAQQAGINAFQSILGAGATAVGAWQSGPKTTSAGQNFVQPHGIPTKNVAPYAGPYSPQSHLPSLYGGR